MRHPIDTLGFDHLVPVGRQHLAKEGYWQIQVEPTQHIIPRCCDLPSLTKRDRRPLFFKDVSLGAEKRELFVMRDRFSCSSCGQTFPESIPEIDDKRRMSKRLIAFVGQKAARHTFAAAGNLLMMDAKSVERIFKDYADDLLRDYAVKLPRVLCLDEKVLSGTACLVVNDGETRRMIDMRASRLDKDIHPYFYAMDSRKDVEVVCQDMWRPYWRMTKWLFPRARTVIDKFHVVRMADWSVEIVRKARYRDLPKAEGRKLKRSRQELKTRWSTAKPWQRERLELVFAAHPGVKEAYFLRERFYDIYERPSRSGAEVALNDWLDDLPPHMRRPFKVLTTAVGNWRPDILRYFEYPFTNAISEGLNRQIAEMNTAGRGYSFATMRQRALVRWGPFQGSEAVTDHR